MRGRARKSNEVVRDGRTRRENRSSPSHAFAQAAPGRPVIERHRPGQGYRQVLMKRDVETFLDLLPDWPELSRELKAVLLSQGDPKLVAWSTPGVVAICAWDRDICGLWTRRFATEKKELLERLEVGVEPRDGQSVFIDWDEPSVKAFQLTDVLLGELLHHHERTGSGSRHEASRGEAYPRWYRKQHDEAIWLAYQDAFGW